MIKTVTQTLDAAKPLPIAYPLVESEFEVQAYLYMTLRARGYDVRGEVQVFGEFGLRKTKAACRFDLVLFSDEKESLCVFEVKARKVKHKTTVEETRQGKRYPLFGVPVHFVYGMEGANEILSMFPETPKKYARRSA